MHSPINAHGKYMLPYRLEIPLMKEAECISVTIAMVKIIEGHSKAVAEFTAKVSMADFKKIIEEDETT